MKKQVKVVMLPTEKATNLTYDKKDNKLEYSEHAYKAIEYIDINNQHLYILSDEEIKEGDWIYNTSLNHIKQFRELDHRKEFALKIIATTDKLMQDGYKHNQLPQIPQSFIEAYVKANGEIDKVMVEYDTSIEWKDTTNKNIQTAKQIITLKLRDDNTVIIHKVGQWTTVLEKLKPIMEEYEVPLSAVIKALNN